MAFTKKGTFGKNYADNLDKNVCSKCNKVVSQEHGDKSVKSIQICQCSVSDEKTETDDDLKPDEKHKN
jgi:hypothetical protein